MVPAAFGPSSVAIGNATWEARGVRSVEEDGDGKRDTGSSAIGDGVEVRSANEAFGKGSSRCEGRAFARFEVGEGSDPQNETGCDELLADPDSNEGVEAGAEDDPEDVDFLELGPGGEFEEREIAASRAEPSRISSLV